MSRHGVIQADPDSPGSIQRGIDALDHGGLVYLPPGSFRIDTTIRLRSGLALIGAGPDLTTITLASGSGCHIFTNDDHRRGNEAIELRGFSMEGNMRTQRRPSDATGITFACGGYFKRVQGLLVDNVAAHAIRQTAFHFNHCSNVELRRLVADQLGWSGVSTSGTDDIVLRRVVVTNAGLDVRHSAIHLDGGCGAYVEAMVDGCTGNGIMLDSTFSPLSDVVVKAAARRSMRGLSLSGHHDRSLANVCITGDYSDNRETGLLVSNASHVFVVNATIASNGKTGIVIQGRAGSKHCVVAGSRITGSPKLFEERDGNQVAYVTGTTVVSAPEDVEPLAEIKARSDRAREVPESSENRLRRVSRFIRRAERSAAAPGKPIGRRTAPPTQPADPDGDCFSGTCNVCGEHQVFVRRNSSLREGYRCSRCKASLRYRGQADAIIMNYSQEASISIAELINERAFARLALWEPGVLGPFRTYFRQLPGYVMSDYWRDVQPGHERDGVRCEDLMALTFPSGSFDLVITSDIFEHVRKPYAAFAEVHRVLRRGGRHIFSIPVQEPMRAATVARVDTSGPDDVFILEPRYHLGPGNSQHIVYNDFGHDLLGRLEEVGFDTEVIRFDSPNSEASRLLTFCSVKRGQRATYLQ
jgi:SAM-dependent methyltransferase